MLMSASAERRALVAAGARDDVDQLIALAHLGDTIPVSIELRKAESCCELMPRARARSWSRSTDRLAHLVPVEIDLLQVGIGAHHCGHAGRPPQLAEVVAGNAEDDRKTDRRPVLEAQHAGSQAAPVAAVVGKTLFEASLEILARGDVVRHDDELGEVVVEQLLIERQVEARAAVAEIAREGP
jgi:hypothetical protein